MSIDLDLDLAPSPRRTLQLAETFAEIVRCLNHATMDHAAFGSPADADRVLREVETAASRLPQLLGQVARWVAAEEGRGCVEVPSGEWAGRPEAAVAALRVRLDAASATAEVLRNDLKCAAHVTNDLGSAEDGTDAGR